jgi:putative membrane protein
VETLKNRHVSDHLANERTLLAWIRTSIAVMTLGVAINRFTLFLMEMHQVVPEVRALANRHVEKLGVGLVVLGIVIMAGAILHYLRVGRMIDDETYRPATLTMVATAIAVVAVGGSTLIWLF